ncbi:MAG TPA: PBSX family phage terminase large subunit [Thermotogota bacterium]|nr:PBSX family phage terminase large subunit [Thermotogota bacterium]
MTMANDTVIDIRFKSKAQEFNDAYIPYLKNQTRYEIFYGGAGSGKSYFIAQRILLDIMQNKKQKVIVARKVARTNRHSTYALLLSIIYKWNLNKFFRVNKSELEITFINGSQIIFSGLDDVEKLKSIANITGIWVEEASEITKEDFMQLDLRLRGVSDKPNWFVLSFNPISQMSWLKSHFFNKPVDNCSILKTTYKDNLRFLDLDYVRVIENLINEDENYHRVYALGEWGVLGNLILTNWVAERVPGEKRFYDQVVYGMDFGFNHASAFLSVGIKDGELYIFDEIYERGLTNTDLIQAVKAKASSGERIVADNAEPDRIEEFRRSGMLVVPAKKGPDSVKAGIDFLRRHRIHVDSSRCPNTIAEIQTWKYKEDKDGNVLEEPVPFKDDAMAALRYATESLRNDNTIRSGRIDW